MRISERYLGVRGFVLATLGGFVLTSGWLWFINPSLHHSVQAIEGTRYVDVGGSCGGNSPCYTSIEEAVNQAELGDLILVYSGVYEENVNIDKVGLTLQSMEGDQATQVGAINPNDNVFTIMADGVTIEGFSILNSSHAGIHISADDIQVLSNTISGNDKGIRIDGGSRIVIDHNDISENRAYSTSDGVYIFDGDHITLTQNIISNNNDEGIQLEMGSTGGEYLNIDGNLINSNSGEGVFFGYSEYLTVKNTAIVGNGQNGVFANNSQHLTFENCLVDDNQGHGIYAAYGLDISIKWCDISNNHSTGLLLTTGESEMPDFWDDAIDFVHDYSLIHSTIANNGGDGINWGTIPISGTITENQIEGNIEHGITFGGKVIDYYYLGIKMVTLASTDHLIAGNTISDNGLGGIYLIWAGDNYIFLNNFVGNGTNGDLHQPYDDNIWHSGVISYTYDGQTYSSELGNYWSDYQGLDGDQNGIGDTDYLIDPIYPEWDPYPLMQRWETYLTSQWEVYLPIIQN